jgi:hypothetical protein
MPRPDFALDLEGPRVTVDRFLHALDGLLRLLREVDREMTRTAKGSVRFVITDLRAASAHLEAVAEPVAPDIPMPPARILETAADGLAALQIGGTRPPFFTDRALEAATGLAHALDRGEVLVLTVRLSARRLEITPRLGAHAQELIRGTLRSLGSVEGRLEVLSVHQRTQCTIYERVTGRAVRCYFPQEELPLVMAAFGRRVTAHGLIWSNAAGEPQSIEVRSAGDIVAFPPDKELPRAGDVRGLLRG